MVFSSWGKRPALGLLVLGLFTLISRVSLAQVAGGTILGTVSDPSSAVVNDAAVSIKNVATGVVRQAATNSLGLYSTPNLKPGEYEVTVSAPGFSPSIAKGIQLFVGAHQTVDFVLKVGKTNDQVQVTGEAPNVELTTSSISAQVNGSTVRELPLNGRDWTQLATLQPGVSTVRGQIQLGTVASGSTVRATRGFGSQLSISGVRPSENNYRLDGISINDYSNDGPGSVLGNLAGVDAIQEFSVITTNYTAEYGKTSGGVINAITRSGTNQLHGNAYEFLRNDALDAANFFDNKNGVNKPPFRRNQFGASLGGPIRKDKTFVFFNYEGLRQSLSTTLTSTVPSANALNGVLSTGTVAVDPLVKPYLALWPAANGQTLGTGDTAQFHYVNVQSGTENFYTGRIDHKLSEKDNLSGSFQYDFSQNLSPDSFNDNLWHYKNSRPFGSIEETHVFSPTLVNSVRFGFNRNGVLVNITPVNPLTLSPSLKIIPGRGAPSINVTGITGYSGPYGNVTYDLGWNNFQAYDDAFLTRGKHSLKFGVAFNRMQFNDLFNFSTSGSFSYGSLKAFLTNAAPSSFGAQISTLTPRGLRESLFGGYLQDDWRLRPNLTLNLGLRYEFVTVPTEAQNKVASLLSLTDSAPHMGAPYFSNPTLKDFDPRVGLVWDPFHDGKTAVRAGFGIFDVMPLLNDFMIVDMGTYPFNVTLSTSNVAAGSFPSTALSTLQANLPAALLNKRVSYVQQNPSRPYVMQWNFNIEREVTRRQSVRVGYIGSRGVRLLYRSDGLNMVLPTKTAAGYLWPSPVGSGTRFNTNFGGIDYTTWGADSFYDALQAEYKVNLVHGLLFQTAYTWGKSIDTSSAEIGGDQFVNSVATNPLFFDPRMRRALSDFDLRQNLVVSGVWNIGNGRSFSGPAAWISKGWQLGGVFEASTGAPFTPSIGGGPPGMKGGVFDFPNRLTGSGCKSDVNPGNPDHYINTACFAVPTPINLMGNAGRNSLVGPGIVSLDSSLFKNNYIHRASESFNVQFRAEVFNLLNHANFRSPLDNSALFNASGTPLGSGGVIDATQTPSRQIQFGVKVIW